MGTPQIQVNKTQVYEDMGRPVRVLHSLISRLRGSVVGHLVLRDHEGREETGRTEDSLLPKEDGGRGTNGGEAEILTRNKALMILREIKSWTWCTIL